MQISTTSQRLTAKDTERESTKAIIIAEESSHNIITSNERRHDSLDPRLNVLESLFSVRFISGSPQIGINENITEQPSGRLCTK